MHRNVTVTPANVLCMFLACTNTGSLKFGVNAPPAIAANMADIVAKYKMYSPQGYTNLFGLYRRKAANSTPMSVNAIGK